MISTYGPLSPNGQEINIRFLLMVAYWFPLERPIVGKYSLWWKVYSTCRCSLLSNADTFNIKLPLAYPWSWILEKQKIAYSAKKCSPLYGTWKVIALYSIIRPWTFAELPQPHVSQGLLTKLYAVNYPPKRMYIRRKMRQFFDEMENSIVRIVLTICSRLRKVL
jgi:hypothetical protein